MSHRALILSDTPLHSVWDRLSVRLFDRIETLRGAGWDLALVTSTTPSRTTAETLTAWGVQIYRFSGQWLTHYLGDGHPDVVIFTSWQLAELYTSPIRQAAPGSMLMLDTVGVQFIRDASRTLVGQRDYFLDEGYSHQLRGELNVFAALDGIVLPSFDSAAVVDLLLGSRRVHVVDDPVNYPAGHRTFEERAGMLFIGQMSDCVDVAGLEFLAAVLPKLRFALKRDNPLTVISDAFEEEPPPSAPSHSSVRMVGWVPSPAPYFARSKILVAPVLFGTACQTAIHQALRCGLPIVATSTAVSGLDLEDGRHVLIADDAAAFCHQITRLLSDADAWHNISLCSRVWAQHRDGASAGRCGFLNAVDAILTTTARALPAPAADVDRYFERRRYLEDQRVAHRLRNTLRDIAPECTGVLVVTDGSAELLKLHPHRASHFPPDADRGHPNPPNDSAMLIQQLDSLRSQGGNYLVFPARQKWWLRYYPELNEYLVSRFATVVNNADCLIFDLTAARRDAHADDQPTKLPSAPLFPSSETRAVKLIAFYLPQFHRIPENDQWWGEGFTEWTNVGRAEPLFPSHYQPHVPADLGFYDLRLAESRRAQADLAREYGVHAFCYYHYWFNGKRLLGRPFDEVLASGEPDFPFCLCWANEPWSRRWDGGHHQVLQAQAYSQDDDIAHIRWLLPALSDRRALQMDGKPVFLVYRPRDLPDSARTCDTWRAQVRRAGLKGLYVIAVETAFDAGHGSVPLGYDAKVVFQPQFHALNSLPRKLIVPRSDVRVFDYAEAAEVFSKGYRPAERHCYETVAPGWDNTPRAGSHGLILHNATPESYEAWLRLAVVRALRRSPEHRVVFINAWNEWAEGAHLEPDLAHGRAFLEATRRALEIAHPDADRLSPPARLRLPVEAS